MVKQGDIILVDFGPVKGREEDKYRPALIVSTNLFNKKCDDIVLVCPISHCNDFPLQISLPEGLNTDGKVQCQHIRSIDLKARSYKYVEHVPKQFMIMISKIIKACIDVRG